MEFSKGNLKLGKNTLIMNFSTARDCPSRHLGLCAVPDKCYALKSEVRFPKTVPKFRERQRKAWAIEKVENIALEIRKKIKNARKHKIEFVRFSEAGDFENQFSVEKLKDLARLVPEITFYGYTARRDLEFKDLPTNLIINGSGFMISNSFTAVKEENINSEDLLCPMDCKDCDLCKKEEHQEIKVKFH